MFTFLITEDIEAKPTRKRKVIIDEEERKEVGMY
jgi:hypothetical protein